MCIVCCDEVLSCLLHAFAASSGTFILPSLTLLKKRKIKMFLTDSQPWYVINEHVLEILADFSLNVLMKKKHVNKIVCCLIPFQGMQLFFIGVNLSPNSQQ